MPNTGKETLAQGEEAQKLPYRINPRRNTVKHILIELTNIKCKEKNIKIHKGKSTNSIQGYPHKDDS